MFLQVLAVYFETDAPFVNVGKSFLDKTFLFPFQADISVDFYVPLV